MAQNMELLVPGHPIEIPDDLIEFFDVMASVFDPKAPIHRSTIFVNNDRYPTRGGSADDLVFTGELTALHEVGIPKLGQIATNAPSQSVKSAFCSLKSGWPSKQDASIAFAESHITSEAREQAEPPLDVWHLYMSLKGANPKCLLSYSWIALNSDNEFAGEQVSWPDSKPRNAGKPEYEPITREPVQIAQMARTVAGLLLPTALVSA